MAQLLSIQKLIKELLLGENQLQVQWIKTNADNEGKEKIVDKVNEIGENTFLKLRQQRDQARSECDQAKIQRDVALRKLNKALQIEIGLKCSRAFIAKMLSSN